MGAQWIRFLVGFCSQQHFQTEADGWECCTVVEPCGFITAALGRFHTFFSFIAVVQVQRDKTEKEEEVFTLQPPSCTLGRIVKSWTDTKHFNITNKTELTSRTLKQCDERRKRKRKREHKVQDDKRVFKPVICFLVDVGDISLSMQVKHFLMSVNWNIAFGLLLLYINNKKQSCMCSVPLFVGSQPEIKF